MKITYDEKHAFLIDLELQQHYSRKYVRLTIEIPGLRVDYRWLKMRRETKNGETIRATYHGK